MAVHQGTCVQDHRLGATGREHAGTPEGKGVRPPLLIAEDDPILIIVLRDYLAMCGFDVHTTDSPQEAREWLEKEAGPLLLDGSVFRQMGIPLAELPKRAAICSGDQELVEEARRLGLRAFCKGSLDGLGELLLKVASKE